MDKLKIIIHVILSSILFGELLAAAIQCAFGTSTLPPVNHPFIPLVRIETGSIELESGKSGNDTFFLRKKFYLPHSCVNGTIYINAYETFSLYLNGSKVASSPNSVVIREFDQDVSSTKFEEIWHLAFQWDVSKGKDYVYIYDISSMLKKGENILAVQLRSPDMPATLALECVIRFKNSEPIKIFADETWKVSDLLLKQWDTKWFMANFDDFSWQYAKATAFPNIRKNAPVCYIDNKMFENPFNASFITHPDYSSDEFFFTYDIKVPANASDLWIRLVSDSYAYIFLNGKYVEKSIPGDLIIQMYDLVQYLVPGKNNQIGVRLVPEEHNKLTSFAMDGAVSVRDDRPLFFSTNNEWRVSNIVHKNWLSPHSLNDAKKAVVSGYFQFYKNSLYKKKYNGVIFTKGISNQFIVLIFLIPILMMGLNFFGIIVIKQQTGCIKLKFVFQLLFACLPGSFAFVLFFIIGSRHYLNSTWIMIKHPLFWQILTLGVISITILLYYRTIKIILHDKIY